MKCNQATTIVYVYGKYISGTANATIWYPKKGMKKLLIRFASNKLDCLN